MTALAPEPLPPTGTGRALGTALAGVVALALLSLVLAQASGVDTLGALRESADLPMLVLSQLVMAAGMTCMARRWRALIPGGEALPVLPVDSLLAVAEDARHRHGCTQVVAVLDARMDEVYVARYAYDAGHWSASGDCSVCAPEAVAVPNGWTVAGNAQAVYGARLAPHAPHVQARPEAAALLRLAPALLAQGLALAADAALPLYVRNKVAQTTAERAAKAAQTGATAP